MTVKIPENLKDWRVAELEKGNILVQQVPPEAITEGGIILPDIAKRNVAFFLVLRTHPDDDEEKRVRAGDWIYLDPPLVRPVQLLIINKTLDGVSDIGWTHNTGHALLIPGPRDGTPVEAMDFRKKDDDDAE